MKETFLCEVVPNESPTTPLKIALCDCEDLDRRNRILSLLRMGQILVTIEPAPAPAERTEASCPTH